ncbi:MAG: hypothetical protein M0R17_03745 [Candidatus Omnitrophica bacterium]|jgi:hypothetical protein|nr:hypothetical protein [Candidatus Omnitrophota bacterium]
MSLPLKSGNHLLINSLHPGNEYIVIENTNKKLWKYDFTDNMVVRLDEIISNSIYLFTIKNKQIALKKDELKKLKFRNLPHD